MRVGEIVPGGKKKKRECASHSRGGGAESEGRLPERTDSNAAWSKGRISLCHSQSIKSILCNPLQTMAKKFQKAPANKQNGWREDGVLGERMRESDKVSGR